MASRSLASPENRMTDAGSEIEMSSSPRGKAISRPRFQIQMRFVAIWLALAGLLLVGRIFFPQSAELSTILSILPFAACLSCATMGQTLVLMSRGIDLSPPAIIALTSTVLLGVSGGRDEWMWIAIAAALVAA